MENSAHSSSIRPLRSVEIKVVQSPTRSESNELVYPLLRTDEVIRDDFSSCIHSFLIPFSSVDLVRPNVSKDGQASQGTSSV